VSAPLGAQEETRMDISKHPCFNQEAKSKYGRVHLPVAPACNVQCNFCDRKHDCVNESRPGVTSVVLSPWQALAYLKDLMQRRPEIAVVGIAGPGDPLANAEATLETLRLVRAEFPEMLLCLATNGLQLAPHVEELQRLCLSHVTITVNAVDPAIGARIYGWMRDGHRTLRGVEGATYLLERQMQALRALQNSGILVKVNSIIIPGINDTHIPEIARRVQEFGAQMMNCIPLIPAPGTPFASIPAPEPPMIHAVRQAAGAHLPQMAHCSRCRADACGLLNEGTGEASLAALQAAAALPLNPAESRPYVAVATREGLLVNRHLGEADEFCVYVEEADGYRLVETRPAPPPGSGRERWHKLAMRLRDCRALLVSGAGPAPRNALAGKGLRVIEMEGLIEEALGPVFRGEELPRGLQRCFAGCGMGCAGNGQGCG
jgi:nitrogen fixation protein NifB